MYRIVLLSLFMSFQVLGFQVNPGWTDSFEKELTLSCGESSECIDYCQGEECSLMEGVVYNSIGYDYLLTHFFFEELGKTLRRNEELSKVDFFDYLNERSYSAIRYDSIENIFRDPSMSLRFEFFKLCPGTMSDPTILFGVDPDTRELTRPELVICRHNAADQVYKITE